MSAALAAADSGTVGLLIVGAVVLPLWIGSVFVVFRRRIRAAHGSVNVESLPYHRGKPSTGRQGIASFRGHGFSDNSVVGCFFIYPMGKAEIGSDYCVIDIMGSRCEFSRDEVVCIFPFSPFIGSGILFVHNIPHYPKYVALMPYKVAAMAECLRASGFVLKSQEEAKAARRSQEGSEK